MNLNDHKKVRALLESEHTLDRETEVTVQAHLYNCADCRTYAEMIAQLQKGNWNPYPPRRLTQTESQTIVSQIRPHLRKGKMVTRASFFNLSSALSLIGLLVIVGLFALAIAQLDQTAVSPLESDSATASTVWYDGWETGVAFQFPASWTITQIDARDNSVITFATSLNETAAPCAPFWSSETNAVAWIVPFDENMPLTPLEFLNHFIESGELTYLETPQAITVHGHSAAYALAEMPCADQFNQITVMTAQTDTHHIFWATGMPAARTHLETTVASLTTVDYAGWQPWQPDGFLYTVMAPTNWNVFDSSKSLEVTPNQQPVWSSFAAPDQPANAPRIFINHNLNAQFGETPQAVVERNIAQMETELALQQVDPPTAHPVVPGMVTAVYTTEDTAVFFGAIAYPRGTISLDPIGATATVPLDQLDSFRPTFERILRSLNGYHAAIPGAPVRAALTGRDTVTPPTATPIALTSPTADDGEFPTPTAVDFSTIQTPATPTPRLHTPTPYTFPSPTPTPTPPTPAPTFPPTPTPTPPTPAPTFPPTPTPTPYTPAPAAPTPTPTLPTPTPTPLPPPTP